MKVQDVTRCFRSSLAVIYEHIERKDYGRYESGLYCGELNVMYGCSYITESEWRELTDKVISNRKHDN